jgi:hypothetical protein
MHPGTIITILAPSSPSWHHHHHPDLVKATTTRNATTLSPGNGMKMRTTNTQLTRSRLSEIFRCSRCLHTHEKGWHHKRCYNPVPYEWYKGRNYKYASDMNYDSDLGKLDLVSQINDFCTGCA